jgi:hypothetical protein
MFILELFEKRNQSLISPLGIPPGKLRCEEFRQERSN